MTSTIFFNNSWRAKPRQKSPSVCPGIVAIVATLLILSVLDQTKVQAQERQMNTADHNSAALDNSTTESETSHAVFGDIVVAGWNDTRAVATAGFPGVTSISGFGYSTDGGVTWIDGGQLAAPGGQALWGDPAVDVDSNGVFYYVSMVGTTGAFVTGLSAFQSTATTPAVTFAAPVAIPSAGGAGTVVDKELIAIDRSGGVNDGRVYIAWSEFSGAFDQTAPIVFARSTSQNPLTFAAPTLLTADDALYQGALPAVGPDGTLYVVWGRFDISGGTDTQIQLRRSLDGGATFQPVQTIATIAAGPNSLTGAGYTHRTRGFPYIATDFTPLGSFTNNNVYVVFQGDGRGADLVDVFFVRSTDGGVTWSLPRSINRTPAVTIGGDPTNNDNWQPSISVVPDTGQITTSFYDRREDTTSADGDAANSRLRLYRAISTDGGLVWFNEPSSTVNVAPAGGYDPLTASSYMGDYNWSASSGNFVTNSWADFRNTCTPPAGAANPCSPAARGDQDAFFDRFVPLSGPDLFIQPWGSVTGKGPLWQSPDVFVVDLSDNEINAAQGVVNRLRARVRNLGTSAASDSVIRFRYAPIFAGIPDSAFKEIGTNTQSFAINETKVVPIDWDLTDTTDTNGGLWPAPISDFEHFCLKVTVELVADSNQANNTAQNNFDDVVLSGGGMGPFRFIVGNPSDEHEGEFRLDVEVPEGYKVRFPDSEFLSRPFKLGRGEIRVANVEFLPPSDKRQRYDPELDQNAHVSLVQNSMRIGGFTMRLEKGRKENKWEHLLKSSYEDVFNAVLKVAENRDQHISLDDVETGLIQLDSIRLRSDELRKYVDIRNLSVPDDATGRIVLSFRVQKAREKTTRLQLGSVVIVDGPQMVITGGIPVRSRGVFENEQFSQIKRVLGLD